MISIINSIISANGPIFAEMADGQYLTILMLKAIGLY